MKCNSDCFLLQEALVNAGDMGRDYEHCLELQKKANDLESAVSRSLGQGCQSYVHLPFARFHFCGFYHQMDLLSVGHFLLVFSWS